MKKRFNKVCLYISKKIDIILIKFLLVGLLNTIVGTVIMFSFYNLFHFNYWVSSAANYVFGSILSYILNKNYTFHNQSKGMEVKLKFIINIMVCYGLAYGIAKPLVKLVLENASVSIKENVSMLIGMVLFVILNYGGQRFLVFAENRDMNGNET